MIAGASDQARLRFASETIGLLTESAAPAIQAELSDEERKHLLGIIAAITSDAPNKMVSEFEALNESMSGDEIRAIEFDQDLKELISALYSFIHYRLTAEPSHVAAVAISRVNSIDYHIGKDDENYGSQNILGSPLMVAEYERLKRLLNSQ